MSCCSSRGKELVIDVPSSPISKQTQRSTQDSNSERFRTPHDSQTFSRIFVKASTMVERIVKLIPWEQHLFLGSLKQKVGLIYLGTSRTQLMNWWRSSIQMLDTPKLSWSVGYKETSAASIQTTLQRFFELIDRQMWILLNMMIDSPKYKTFFKFLGLIMIFLAKAHP